MVNRSDNDEKNPISAEALYKHYQHIRPVSTEAPRTDSDLNVSASSAKVDEPQFAESVYKHYQGNRASETQSSIDTIMQKIEQQSLISVLQQDEQPPVSSGVPDIQAIDAKPGLVNEQAQIDAPAANSTSIFKRWMLPGIAAAILGVVLIPMLMTTGTVPDDALQATLPVALSDRAAHTVAYIEAPKNASFGFADTTNAAPTAFHNGAMVVDLQLLIDAEQTTKMRPFLRVLVAGQGSAQNNDVDLHSQVQSSAIIMNDAITAVETGGESTVVLNEHLEKISIALEDMARKSNQLDWYVAGRSVESIRVAAEYALESSDIEPLEQALLLGSQIALPVQEAPASVLLATLLESDLSGSEEFEQVSEVLDKARDIKLLMQ